MIRPCGFGEFFWQRRCGERDDYELELRMLNDDTENQNYERLAILRSKLMQIAPRIEELDAAMDKMKDFFAHYKQK